MCVVVIDRVAAAELMELTRRQPVVDMEVVEEEDVDIVDESEPLKAAGGANAPLGTPLQRCIAASVVLDFAGCLFSNVGLSMAGSGLFQVVYSSVICWSAMLSRCVLKKVVSTYEWTGIALVTFGLAFSALGESSGGRTFAPPRLVLLVLGADAACFLMLSRQQRDGAHGLLQHADRRGLLRRQLRRGRVHAQAAGAAAAPRVVPQDRHGVRRHHRRLPEHLRASRVARACHAADRRGRW